MTRLRTVIGVLLLLGGMVACTPPAPESPPLQPHTERNGPAGQVPAGLERFYGQELHWGPCESYATTQDDRGAYRDRHIECARLEVPLDYTHPQGRTINLGVLRKPVADKSQRIGSLVINPGGPGASGMSAAASLAATVSPSELGQRFDLVGFDPRGVAASQPEVQCLKGPERDAERRDSDADVSPAGVARSEAEEMDYAHKCAERTGADLLSHVGTRDVAKDLDVLRSALGDPKLSYLGYSYGTRIGAEYAKQFPASVRALVLDGAIDPGQSSVDAMVAQGAGFQKAFNAFAQWCAGQDSCALGPDPRRAVSVFQHLTRPLVQHPVPAGPGRELSYSDATTAAIQALYAQSLWPPLNNGLRELAQNHNGQALMQLADSYFGREPDGKYSNVTDAFDAVRCVDDQRVSDRSQVQEADRRYRESAPFLDDGHGPSPALDPCAFWPVPVTGDAAPPHHPPNLPPVLVISTTGDPATPYQAGVRLAAALHGALLTYQGTQHTVFLEGNKCVDDAGFRYLIDLTLPPKNTRCS